MKRNIFFVTVFFFSIAILNAETLNEKKALEFAKKYRLADLNQDKKDLSYLNEFSNKAEEEINKVFNDKKNDKKVEESFEYLKEFDDKKINNFKSLGSLDEKEREKVQINEARNKKNDTSKYQETVVPELATEEIVIVESEETLDDIAEIEEQNNKEKMKKDSFINTLKKQTGYLTDNEVLKNNLEKVIEESEEYNETQITFFFFASSDLDISNFNNFIGSVDKLQRRGYNVVGRVIFFGLIDGSFDGMANWLKTNKNDNGLKSSPNIKYQFHPWAFEYFDIKRVPAFALSSCKKDFRFKTCDNKYLIKGNISFLNFIETLSDNNKDYKKMYFDLVETEHGK